MAFQFTVNGASASLDVPFVTPLLWVIREQLKLTGTKFGCGVGLCGACVAQIDSKRAFSCQTQLSNVASARFPAGLVWDKSDRTAVREWIAIAP
jgi:isoquinoline 1-oxidoreductase subunit alpha